MSKFSSIRFRLVGMSSTIGSRPLVTVAITINWDISSSSTPYATAKFILHENLQLNKHTLYFSFHSVPAIVVGEKQRGSKISTW